MEKTFKSEQFDIEISIGKFANQADGSVWFKRGGTVLLATVVAEKSKEFPGFLPLTTEYREPVSAAGKIPGGYYKREGRPTEKEILTSRLIDRAIRPLFPPFYFNQVQVIVTVYSVDKEHTPNTIALLAASLALTLSKIPFLGPVGVIEIARVNGQWVFDPKYSSIKDSDVRLVVAGTDEGICMVEGSGDEITESEFIDVLFKAHELIRQQVAWQLQLQKEINVAKESIVEDFDWSHVIRAVDQFLTPERLDGAFLLSKTERGNYLKELKETFLGQFVLNAMEPKEIPLDRIEYVFDYRLNDRLAEQVLERGKRIDGRRFDEVRPVHTQVGLLPFTHGSALFIRGGTQVLTSVTLGGDQDEQRIDDLMGDTIDQSFMLHYNFPPFSVGEARPLRGPGRREIGHGHLAMSALEPVLPNKESFGYTIRIVADVLASDGSTSQGTICSATMALMNAGVPIRDMVSGVAMGLLRSQAGAFQALTDISGFEDAFGLMDFKVAGTQKGITAIQMDIKYKGGLARDVFEKALAQAKEGRMYILHEMQKVMSKPNPQLSELVPQIVSFKVATEKIGAIIGKGGAVIRDIIDKTGTTIDIDDDGLVKIFGHPGPKLDVAVSWVKILGGHIEVGKQYPGKIKRTADFGIFVELAPGVDGLVHISTIPREKQTNLAQYYPSEQEVLVEVLDYDTTTGRIRLRFVK